MNKSVLKKIVAVFAAAMTAVCVSAGAFAATSAPATARPQPGTSTSSSSNRNSSSNSSNSSSNSSNSSSNSNSDNDDNEDTNSSSNSDNNNNNSNEERATVTPVTVAPVSTVSNKSYTTKIGAFLWFLLSVLVNTIVSFAIGNRFYKLARKETHVTAEIRALRHDIEEKFADNIGGFTEPSVDISNDNEIYSNNSDGIKMTPASTTSVDAPVEDIYQQWEEQMARRRAERRAAITTRPEVEEAFEEEEAPVKKYQPKRTSHDEPKRIMDFAQKVDMSDEQNYEAEEIEVEDEIEEETEYRKPTPNKNLKASKPAKKKNNAGVAKKAKNFINNIFPLKDDDDEDIDDLD